MISSLASKLRAGQTAHGIALKICYTFALFGTTLVVATQATTDLASNEQIVRVIANMLPALIVILMSTVGLYYLTANAVGKLVQLQEETIESQVEIMRRLAVAAEFRDGATRKHTHRVGRYAEEIAWKLTRNREYSKLIFVAAQLHDIGKVGIPDAILHKPGGLNADEIRLMQRHVEIGGRLLGGGSTKLMQMAESIAWTHHERFDGTGYPLGLRGDQIPLEGRITALADVFDALMSSRSYKESWSFDRALDEIRSASGTHFDPQVVEAFQNCMYLLQKLTLEYEDNSSPDVELFSDEMFDSVRDHLRSA